MISLLLYFTIFLNPLKADSYLNYQLKQADQLYLDGYYEESIQIYKNLLPTYPLGEIYYNLGTCYLAQEDTISALIHLKRAHTLLPRDSDVKNNIQFINKKLGISNNHDRTIIHFFVREALSFLSKQEFLIFTCLLWCLICLALTIHIFVHSSLNHTLCFSLLMLVILLIVQKYPQERNLALVARKSPFSLYNSPDSTSEKVGEILFGQTIQIIKSSDNWLFIESHQNSGWILTNNRNELRRVDNK